MVGLLIPSPPWSGRLVSASAKAVAILHPDGALVSVVGFPSYMESRSMMPAAGFCDFAARAAELLDTLRLQQACDTVGPVGSSSSGGMTRDVEPLQATWDGQRLSVVPCASAMPMMSMVSAASLVSVRSAGLARGPDLVLDLGSKPSVWDPRERLTGAARRFLAAQETRGGLSAATAELNTARLLTAELRTLLAKAYAAGRRAEGLHGTGAFAQGFRRLLAHSDFPAVAVGFGPGTTPAGDDWLAGYLVALDLREGGPGKAVLPLRQRIRGRLDQTTAAGRALLQGALAGSPPEYLVALAEAAAQGLTLPVPGQELFRAAVAAALAHGATSGEDALAGFLYGLEAARESEAI